MGIIPDQHWMRFALEQAYLAAKQGEVPIGAVLVYQNKIIAEGFNQCVAKKNAMLHAEVVVIEQACEVLQNYRLNQCTLYVTVEPCMMCCGALIQARLARVVYGASESKTGCVHSHLKLLEQTFLNHKMLITSAVLKDECQKIMSDFFINKRKIKVAV
ncbi:MAG: tRNA adenosine(34) deaminase TadA [Saccharospirillaceae bacterium]|nr:tRNA adenosine(34) deaminase TadA [Pseudomonadales bacterium]NRB80908.1 tRNA adenosine(34) deaminase TadA [Saccharospirillaceae bacterium]